MRRACLLGRGTRLTGALDQLDAVAVGVLDEAEARPTLADAVGRALGLDALLGEPPQRAVQILHTDGDVAVRRAQLVGAAVVVERQLELLLLAGQAKEVVRRLELAVPDDRQLAPEVET